MADYPVTKLEKALARRGASTSGKPAWQELMGRHDTVPASKAIQAPDALSGFSGSWAASYELAGSVRDAGGLLTPAQVQRRTNRLGQPGMAEINFRPYDVGTSRHGKYGPSLLGHPISFQIVGPTARAHASQWQWWVSEVATGAGPADCLNLDACTIYSTAGTPLALPVSQNDLFKLYGLLGLPTEGLYIVISMTGAPGYVTDNDAGGNDGGLGDGIIGDDAIGGLGGGARTAVIPQTPESKYEIFRVVEVGATFLTLDSSKRLGDYFALNIAGETPVIRSITLMSPAATRLVAVPGSNSQTFAFVPPKEALATDLMPTHSEWTVDGKFDPWSSGLALNSNPGSGYLGLTGDYAQSAALPVPVPLSRGRGRLWDINGEPAAQATTNAGRMQIVVNSGEHFDAVADVGRIIKIYDVRSVNGGTWATANSEGLPLIGEPEMDRLLGWFEIMDTNTTGANSYVVRWVAQFDPETGLPFFASNFMLRMATGSAPGQQVDLTWTLHDPIETLWTSNYLHPTKLDSARLQNLIDPQWVRPTMKGRELAEMDGHPATPDKAIFETATRSAGADGTNANPGSLLDLGFRVVLFPAKDEGGRLVPNFDTPIDTNEVVLDATKPTENQWLEIDYAAGLVHLSHPPVGTNQLVTDPTILNSADNPRGEVVFFASCVPFSREPGQMGVNPRITAGHVPGRAGSFCNYASPEPTDAYGARVWWPAAIQTLASGPQNQGGIILDDLLTPLDLPLNGFVDVLIGESTPAGTPLHANAADERLCTFGYSRVEYNDGGNTVLYGTFGGADPTATYGVVPGTTPATVVLRRNIVMPNTMDGRAGTDYQHDTTYGFAKRTTALRFEHGTMTPEVDGSMTISTKDPRTDAHAALFSELFSSWCINGGVQTETIPDTNRVLRFTEMVVLIAGVRTVLPEQDFEVSATTDGYVYIDGTDPLCPVYAESATLALPTDNDVLVGRFRLDITLSFVTEWYDLRNPLVDIDKRLDITVGSPEGHAQPGDAHFNELADAVMFVANTYRADEQVGASDVGRFRRIKIIGRTTEQNAKLPIRADGVSGIIIEGASWPLDGMESDPYAITWYGDAGESPTDPPLFDLTGTSGWVFRNLVFRYVALGGLISATVPNHTLFTVQTGAITDCLFENILLHGPAHGFFHIEDVRSSYDNLTFRNCMTTEVTDFAIRAEATITTVSENLRVYNCDFTQDWASAECSLLDGGIIHVEPVVAAHMTVRDTYLSGGDVGIRDYGDHLVVDACRIEDIQQAALYLAGEVAVITGNYFQNVHMGAASIHTSKVAIMASAAGGRLFIAGNFIDITSGADTDDALYLTVSQGSNVIEGNRVTVGGINGGAFDHIDNNTVLAGDLTCLTRTVAHGNLVVGALTVTGNECRISSNYFARVLSGSGGDNCWFSNNWFWENTANNHVAGSNCSFHGDVFGQPAFGAGGKLQPGSENVYVGCTFTDGFVDLGSDRDKNRFEGCRINLWADQTIVGNNNSFSGCLINGMASDVMFAIDGIGTSMKANTFTIATMRLFDSSASGLERFVFSDNKMIKEALDYGGLWLKGSGSTITGNQIEGWETDSTKADANSLTLEGEANTVGNNVFDKGLNTEGNFNTITGNYVGSSVVFGENGGTPLGRGTMTGNTVTLNVNVTSRESVFSHNIVGGTLDLSSDRIQAEGNRVGGLTTLVGDYLVVVGNIFEGAVDAEDDPNYLAFKSNRVEGAATFGGVRLECDLVGNRFESTFDVNANNSISSSSITGNTFEGAVNFYNGAGASSIEHSTVAGNYFLSTMTANKAVFTTFSGNRFQNDVTLTSSPDLVFSGNWVGTDGVLNPRDLLCDACPRASLTSNVITGKLFLTGSHGCMISSNQVGYNGGGAGDDISCLTTDDFIIQGNRVHGDILVSAGAGYGGVIMGNRCANIGDGSGGVLPATLYVIIGNRLNVTSGQVFTVASPPQTTIEVHNATDDAAI